MESVFKSLLGYKKQQQMPTNRPTTVFKQPIIPRFALEVNKHSTICMASGTPSFITKKEELNIPDFIAHIKARLVSEHFVGFVMACLVENEDLVDRLNLFPHVFQQRIFLYRPNNVHIIELCALLSMLEGLKVPTLKGIASIIQRARHTYSKFPSTDAAFILHGIETLGYTLIHYYSLDSSNSGTKPHCLMMYKLHKAIGDIDPDVHGLLKSIYFESSKIITPYTEDNTDDTFNLFYSETIFTKHFKCKEIIKAFKLCCLRYPIKTVIFS